MICVLVSETSFTAQNYANGEVACGSKPGFELLYVILVDRGKDRQCVETAGEKSQKRTGAFTGSSGPV